MKDNCCETTSCDCVDRVLNTPCPVEKTVEKNTEAFFEAMHAAKVEIIKEKIKSEWGECLEKEADATLKAMGIYWKSMLAQAKSQCDFREDIKKIFLEGCCDESKSCNA